MKNELGRRRHSDGSRAHSTTRVRMVTILVLIGVAPAMLPSAGVVAAPATPTIAAARRLAPGTIVRVAGSAAPGPTTASSTSIGASALARTGSTLFLADQLWGVIRAVDLTTGRQRVIAGNGERALPGTPATEGDGGPATAAPLRGAFALAADATGTVYLSSPAGPWPGGGMPTVVEDSSLRRVGADGVISTMPGLPPKTLVTAMVTVPDGALLAGDQRGLVHRVVDGTSTVIAGTADPGPDAYDDGVIATHAALGPVQGLAFGPDEQLYVATRDDVRRIDGTGHIHTVARVGGTLGIKADGTLILTADGEASLVTPDGAVSHLAGCRCASTVVTGRDPAGLDRWVIAAIADPDDRVLMIATDFTRPNPSTQVVRTEPDGSFSTVAGTGTLAGGAGGPAQQSQFHARDVAALPDGSLVLSANEELWRIGRDGAIGVLVAHGELAGPELEAAGLPSFSGAVTVDAAGAIYIVMGRVIRRVDPSGRVTTYAGDGTHGMPGDRVPALATGLGTIGDIAAGAPGEVYVSDQDNDLVRRVGPDGVITTVAGRLPDPMATDPMATEAMQSGDGGPATSARLADPRDLVVGHDGSVYVLDGAWYSSERHPAAVRRIAPDGTITRVLAERPGAPIVTIALDGADDLVFAEGSRPDFVESKGYPCVCQILRRTPNGMVEVLAGAADASPRPGDGDGGPATQATIDPRALTMDASDNLFLLDDPGTRVREVVAVGAAALPPAPPAGPIAVPPAFAG